MSENNLKMSSSPHIRSKATTSNIMMLVAIALLPASAFLAIIIAQFLRNTENVYRFCFAGISCILIAG